jgi:flagellar M-ring protein FliF
MAASLAQLVANLGALSPARRLALALASAGSLAFFAWIVLGASGPSYQALYRGLEAEEAARVVDGLGQEKISYRLEDSGTSVLVPATQVQEARIRLAGRGLPSGGAAGFELFDRPAFGVTDFVHRVNFLRALQGELSRTIEHLDPVERAHVQLALPERGRVLASRDEPARASVIVRLRPGRELASNQVDAIVHLVASSVENLDTRNVAVVDGAGRLLAPREGQDGELAGVEGGVAYQQRVEAQLAESVETLLAKTLGAGNVVARVRAEMDWTERQVTEEVFDPESQVARSEQHSTETSQDAAPVGGAPGLVANDPSALPAGGAEAAPSASRESETINYEISKKVLKSSTPRGEVKRLSIAVLVADPVAPVADAAAGEAPAAAPVPWTPEQIEAFAQLARKAVGFDEKRGDVITVSSAPFRAPDQFIGVEEPSPIRDWLPIVESLVRGAALAVALLLFARLIVRPALASVSGAAREASAPAGGSAALGGAGSGERSSALGLGERSSALALEEAGSAALPPADGVRALRNWLNQG